MVLGAAGIVLLMREVRGWGPRVGPRLGAAVRVRLATEEVWPQIWPSLREVAAAGQTFTDDGHLDDLAAQALPMMGKPGVVAAADEERGEGPALI